MKHTKPKIKFVWLVLVLLFLFNICPSPALYSDSNISPDKIKTLEAYIEKQAKTGKIPGLAVTITEGDKTVYQKGFGYANIKQKKPVTEDTLFEIGSTSKAFTGLGILLMEKQGLINLNDPVSKYIPWFKMKYKGQYVNITVGQCLYQTSGIPFKTIGDIPIASDGGALERTIRTLVDQELDHYPGEEFLYATINYDILGLIIQNIAGKSYEEYMKQNILEPLGLNATYLHREAAYSLESMATGYKAGFLVPREHAAPPYRGNTPAGYFIMNVKDMARWVKIQTGAIDLPDVYKDIIVRSHIPDRTVDPSGGGGSYAGGWQVYQSGTGELAHAGGNPNFSSYIVFRPEEKIGVAVMANSPSDYTSNMGQGIMDILQGRKVEEISSDSMASIDGAGFSITVVGVLFILSTMVFIAMLIWDLIKKRRKAAALGAKSCFALLISIGFILGFGYCLYLIPSILYNDLPWEFVRVWAPFSFIPAVITVFATAVLITVYLLLGFYFPKQEEKPIFPLVVLSFISGFGNAFIIFTINEALNREKAIESGLLWYLILGIVLYVFGQKILRERMVTLANDLIYSKRMQLITRLLNTPFYRFEKVESGKIHAGLNNDTEILSRAPGTIILGLTSIVTLLCCFIYLGTINFWGLWLSILIIFIAAGLYFAVGSSANKLLERSRDIQNIFFKFINDLIQGFKELSLNGQKRNAFQGDMEKACDEYRQKSTDSTLKFTNVFIIGELLFTFVIGAVAFLFPILFENIQTESLRAYIFVFLYMAAPVRGILNTIPEVFRIRVSWNRINQLIEEVSQMELKEKGTHEEVAAAYEDSNKKVPSSRSHVKMRLEDIEYQYDSNDQIFKVGPINLEFNSGEVTFITGGNGSGKTTLSKLITGLYKWDKGRITINGMSIDHARLGDFYSNVFSDYHLFEKLYGINHEEKTEDIGRLLKILQIDQKLVIKDGKFSTLSLSSGQRKRLALLISYLDDKDIFLFDEWAADQDPEFKKFFYHTLLSELRQRNKCVIAITHDDHYFHVADKVVKLDMGQIDKVTVSKGHQQ